MNIWILRAVPVLRDKLVLRSLRAAESSTGRFDGDGDASGRLGRAIWGTGAAVARPHIVAASSPRISAFTMTETY